MASDSSTVGRFSASFTDNRSIEALKAAAARDPKATIKEASKQFEALFMQEVMKSMRSATLSSGMMENSATQLDTEMLDTQFAGKMTGLPGGLSQAIERHLQRQMGITPETLNRASGTGLERRGDLAGTNAALPQLAKKNVQDIRTEVQGLGEDYAKVLPGGTPTLGGVQSQPAATSAACTNSVWSPLITSRTSVSYASGIAVNSSA